jgi:hypothetical protein
MPMNGQPHVSRHQARGVLRRDGRVSLAALLLAFAVFDDITTDDSNSFRVEYSALIACAAWFAVLTLRLLRHSCSPLGILSLAALTGALWAQPAIVAGTTPGLWPEYVVMTGAFFWFLALAIWLIVIEAPSRDPWMDGEFASPAGAAPHRQDRHPRSPE